MSDKELLRDFSRDASEEAFAELVRRHVNLVFSSALRHVGNTAHAEEISQAVFLILAQKAARLRSDTILEGWLYETTRLTALSFLRGERRRQFREQEAYMQSTLPDSATNSAWEQLAPLLDEAMAHLGKKDRDAVVLRFFKDKSMREIAAALNVNEAAAQKRGVRALEKLRLFFAKRGVALTTTIIAGAVSANSIQAAPVALAASITAVAIAKGAAATGTTLTLINGVLKIMAWTKIKTGIVSAIVVAGVATPLVIQHQANLKLREENRALRLKIPERPIATATETDSTERNLLNEEKSELLRLRDEVGRWRLAKGDVAKLRTEVKTPAPAITPKQEQNKLPKESWVDAGFATPEAALQTRGWTVLQADRERFKESIFITDDGKKVLEGMLDQMIAGSPDPEKARQQIEANGLTMEDGMLFPMIAQNKNIGLAGYEILSRQSPSADETILEVETQMTSGKPHQETMKFRRIGNEWKVVIDAETIMANMQKPRP